MKDENKDSKELSLNKVLKEAQEKDKTTRRALELPEAEILTTPEAEAVIAKPNRKVKGKSKKSKAKKEKQALIRERKRQENHMELLKKGWDKLQQLESRLAALSGILEARAKNIEKYAENLKASQDILASRQLRAKEARKNLEGQGKEPLLPSSDSKIQ